MQQYICNIINYIYIIIQMQTNVNANANTEGKRQKKYFLVLCV